MPITSLPTIDYILFTLVLGAYGFAWACYKKLSHELETILTNHLVHIHEENDKIWRAIERLEEKSK